MQNITIWHNPRCSKSRQALEILQNYGATLSVRRYLDDPPTPDEIRDVLQWLGGLSEQAIRRKEESFQTAGLGDESLSFDDKCKKMAAFPKVIERPIVFVDGNAIVARPPEKLHPWLDALGDK